MGSGRLISPGAENEKKPSRSRAFCWRGNNEIRVLGADFVEDFVVLKIHKCIFIDNYYDDTDRQRV